MSATKSLFADAQDLPYGHHPLDRYLNRIMNEGESDLPGTPNLSVVAREAAEAFPGAMESRKRKGQPISPDLHALARLSPAQLRQIISERLRKILS